MTTKQLTDIYTEMKWNIEASQYLADVAKNYRDGVKDTEHYSYLMYLLDESQFYFDMLKGKKTRSEIREKEMEFSQAADKYANMIRNDIQKQFERN